MSDLVEDREDQALSKLLNLEFDKPERLRAFEQIAWRFTDVGYWQVFRHIYEMSESIYRDQDVLRRLFQSERPGREYFMSTDERKKLAEMGNWLQVYRGCWSGNTSSWSFTLSKKVARFFATRCPYDNKPVILICRVKRENVLGYLTGRQEEEIVAAPENVLVKHVQRVPFNRIGQSQILLQEVQAGTQDEPQQMKDAKLALQIVHMRKHDLLKKLEADTIRRVMALRLVGFDQKAIELQQWLESLRNPPDHIMEMVEKLEVVERGLEDVKRG